MDEKSDCLIKLNLKHFAGHLIQTVFVSKINLCVGVCLSSLFHYFNFSFSLLFHLSGILSLCLSVYLSLSIYIPVTLFHGQFGLINAELTARSRVTCILLNGSSPVAIDILGTRSCQHKSTAIAGITSKLIT